MKTGFFSPLPPDRTGVADYAAALLGEMRRSGEVEVGSASAPLALYHLGNNQLHRGIYERALRHPGVAVIHDAVLQHFFLGSLSETAYIAEFVFNYGAWSEDLARTLWLDRARSAADPRYFQYPMLKRIAAASKGVIVHNPAAAKIVRDHAPEARIHEIPHLFAMPPRPAPYAVERLRHSLGCSAATLLCGVFGHLRESKRLPGILRVYDRLRAYRHDIRLLIAGEFASRDLERAIAPWRGRPGIHWTGYLTEERFWLYASAIDVCLNLRYPTAGESSGIAVRLMGLGKVAIVTEGLETSRFPNSSCLRAEAGPGEEDSLFEYLDWLAGHRAARDAIGQAAAQHIQSEHSLPDVARQYWQSLQHCYHRITPIDG